MCTLMLLASSFLKKTNQLDCEEFKVAMPTLVHMYSEHYMYCE